MRESEGRGEGEGHGGGVAGLSAQIKAMARGSVLIGYSLLSLLSSATPDHSSLLLHVKQLVSDLRSLSCQMAALQGNGEGHGHQPHFLARPPPIHSSISAFYHPPDPLRLCEELLPHQLGGVRRQLLLVLQLRQALG